MLCFCSNGHIIPVQMDTVCMILLDIERYRGHKLTSHLHSLVNIIALMIIPWRHDYDLHFRDDGWLWQSRQLFVIFMMMLIILPWMKIIIIVAMIMWHYSHRCSSLLTATETRFAQYVAHVTNLAQQRGLFVFRGCPQPTGDFMKSFQKRENPSFP